MYYSCPPKAEVIRIALGIVDLPSHVTPWVPKQGQPAAARVRMDERIAQRSSWGRGVVERIGEVGCGKNCVPLAIKAWRRHNET